MVARGIVASHWLCMNPEVVEYTPTVYTTDVGGNLGKDNIVVKDN